MGYSVLPLLFDSCLVKTGVIILQTFFVCVGMWVGCVFVCLFLL